MNAPSNQRNQSADQYEVLRRHFLEERGFLSNDPLGLTLLLRKGMAAWIRTWRSNSEPAPGNFASFSRPSWSAPESSGWQQELTQLIAQMTARHLC